MAHLTEYVPIVGQAVIDDLRRLGERLDGKAVQNVNSTAVGGGVAEILNRMVPLLQELGVRAGWDVIKGGEQFFGVTKKFHNALHGRAEVITRDDFDIFLDTGRKNNAALNIYGDVVFIHDPQPIMLVEKKQSNKWIWRCHVDVSHPDDGVWQFLMGFIRRYDGCVFSSPSFSRPLPIRQFLITPSIDPLSDKNRELPEETVERMIRQHGLVRDKPIITQISRFDRLKDPLGVLKVYQLVKKHIDCQLILAGGTAADDPEGLEVLAEVREQAGKDPDIHILLLPQDDLLINALQRASDVIMQKSLKEGFGLTVSEALWKGKPVVASAVGGIPLQITHKYSGLLCHSIEGAAFAVKQLLNSPAYAQQLGKNGREHVRNNFLLTRHVRDYLLLFLSMYYENDVVRL
ncbi:MAG: glycosyltransferase [Candidatus Omnitrophica bacterium]|nr:glycosyltransferase [Candidatus Omnitrophota bacterium]